MFSDKPNTELPKADIMGLLKDPSSLVQVRDSSSSLRGNKQIRNSFHVVGAAGPTTVSVMLLCSGNQAASQHNELSFT